MTAQMIDRKEAAAAAPAPQKQAQTLSQVRSDVLALVDIVSGFSDAAALATRGELLAEFVRKAPEITQPSVDELHEQMNATMAEVTGRQEKRTLTVRDLDRKKQPAGEEVLSTREQRKILTRRELLAAILNGELTEELRAAEQAERQAEESAPERTVTEEYFDQVLAEVLQGGYGVEAFEAWDGKTYYHYRPLLSSSYARILSAQGNPLEQLRDTVRENSRVYPRPVALELFQNPPFNMTAEQLEEILHRLADDGDSQDIRYTQTSVGSIYLYSRKYLTDEYADFLAEDIDVGGDESP